MSPDTVSSLFPDRPIRPLPKRKLRERLSPEATQTIKYPPSADDGIYLSYYPTYTATARTTARETQGSSSQSTETESSGSLVPIKSHGSYSSNQGPSAVGQRRGLENSNINLTAQADSGAEAQHTLSATSSIDGYDSFENASNKKKRKIPSATDTTLRSLQSMASDPANVSQSRNGVGGISHTPATGCTTTGSLPMYTEGISGSGRGRLGRSESTRNPFGTVSDGNNVWPGKLSGPGCQKGGIISSAIANAEKLPSPGQENTDSLLRQPSASGKGVPMASQFTFTFESQMSDIVSWPDASPDTSTAVEDTPLLPSKHSSSVPSDVSGYTKAGKGRQRRTGGSNCRPLERDLALAARDRKQAATDNYYRSPPKLEDVWICEFCEYERIFGSPPKALIREYELKDRRLRQEEADRRRLMEKAKAKGRKSRKANKGVKGAHSPEPASEKKAVGEAPAMKAENSHSTQSQGGYEDGFDDYRARAPPDILGLYEKRRTRKADL